MIEATQQTLPYIDLVIAAIAGLIASPVTKILITAIFPQTAPLFALFNRSERQLNKVIDYSANNNADLREWAKQNGLKIAAKLIK